jgi:hypothetical protein
MEHSFTCYEYLKGLKFGDLKVHKLGTLETVDLTFGKLEASMSPKGF